jgi:hypothetical protein
MDDAWAGVIVGSLVVAYGVWLLHDPDGNSRVYHGIDRALYRAFHADYDGSSPDRLTRRSIRVGAFLSCVAGSALFVAGLVEFIRI